MIIFYTTGCPHCFNLKRKLDERKINYKINNNVEEMISKGFQEAPKLEVDGKVLSYQEALEWVEKQ